MPLRLSSLRAVPDASTETVQRKFRPSRLIDAMFLEDMAATGCQSTTAFFEVLVLHYRQTTARTTPAPSTLQDLIAQCEYHVGEQVALLGQMHLNLLRSKDRVGHTQDLTTDFDRLTHPPG